MTGGVTTAKSSELLDGRTRCRDHKSVQSSWLKIKYSGISKNNEEVRFFHGLGSMGTLCMQGARDTNLKLVTRFIYKRKSSIDREKKRS